MDDDTEAPAEPRTEQGRFVQGSSGNPAGRPKGSRNKLSEAFWNDLAEAWDQHGKEAMKTLATEEPAKFVQVAASLMPKEVKVSQNPIEDMTDEQLEEAIAALSADIRRLREAKGGWDEALKDEQEHAKGRAAGARARRHHGGEPAKASGILPHRPRRGPEGARGGRCQGEPSSTDKALGEIERDAGWRLRFGERKAAAVTQNVEGRELRSDRPLRTRALARTR
jgi:hypothetical protein